MAVSAQTYARIAGVLFLISAVAGGFGEFFVPLQLIVSNDATATANNIMSSRRPRIRDQELVLVLAPTYASLGLLLPTAVAGLALTVWS